jgi:hypothetical protein
MSVELYIFVADSKVPSREAWMQTIDELGFPTILDPMLDVRTHTGFLPATYAGKQTGFEFQVESAADIIETYATVRERIGDRDKCASFRWGGDLNEMAAAISSAAALAKAADGIYFYPDDEIFYDAAEAVAATRADLNSL